MSVVPTSEGDMAIVALTAAVLLCAVAVATATRHTAIARRPYLAALLVSAIWLLAGALTGADSIITWITEAARNLCWLWFMAAIAGARDKGSRTSPIGWIYIGLFAIEAVLAALLVGIVISGNPPLEAPRRIEHMLETSQMLFSAGVLVLLHNLIEAGRADERRALVLPMSALAGMWVYDLNLFAISYLSGSPAALLIMLRPAAMLVVTAALGIAALRPAGHSVQLSRPATFRSLALAGVCGWLAMLSLLAVLMSNNGFDFGEQAQVAVLAASIVAVALLLVSARLRAYLKVWTAKHFFEHRYDYRVEWLRFTQTLNRPEAGGLSLDARVVKAIADIVESPGGALVSNDGAGHFSLSAAWPKGSVAVPTDGDWTGFCQWLSASERIVQFDELRRGKGVAGEVYAVPRWTLEAQALWIAVPLVHLDRMEGVVLLERPPLNRALDWEDFDLLKVAGRQAASHLSEARGAEALAESARFEEFHRRFAFMMHDVKNLASQMALLSRNVERHGDNPDFREDMVATLRLSADRLGQMMQRLSQQERVRIDRVEAVDLAAIANRVAGIKRSIHAVEVVGNAPGRARADHEMTEQLLVHLVQNAIDATAGIAPVLLQLGGDARHVSIVVADKGVGMSPEFLRSDLFRPFSSTKDGGFGIGAYQARQLAEAMGGVLHVESEEGKGTRFTLTLPNADGPAGALESHSEAA